VDDGEENSPTNAAVRRGQSSRNLFPDEKQIQTKKPQQEEEEQQQPEKQQEQQQPERRQSGEKRFPGTPDGRAATEAFKKELQFLASATAAMPLTTSRRAAPRRQRSSLQNRQRSPVGPNSGQNVRRTKSMSVGVSGAKKAPPRRSCSGDVLMALPVGEELPAASRRKQFGNRRLGSRRNLLGSSLNSKDMELEKPQGAGGGVVKDSKPSPPTRTKSAEEEIRALLRSDSRGPSHRKSERKSRQSSHTGR